MKLCTVWTADQRSASPEQVPEDATYEQLLALDERDAASRSARRGIQLEQLDRITALQTLSADQVVILEKNDDAECKICLEKYSEGDRLRRLVRSSPSNPPPSLALSLLCARVCVFVCARLCSVFSAPSHRLRCVSIAAVSAPLPQGMRRSALHGRRQIKLPRVQTRFTQLNLCARTRYFSIMSSPRYLRDATLRLYRYSRCSCVTEDILESARAVFTNVEAQACRGSALSAT